MIDEAVREKLARRIGVGKWERALEIADNILQSPQLRVTLVEPRYTLQTFGGNMTTVERDGKWIATFDSRSDAETYMASKEQK